MASTLSRRVEAFHAARVASGVDAEISGDIRRAIWAVADILSVHAAGRLGH